jgi:hypothetical protein
VISLINNQIFEYYEIKSFENIKLIKNNSKKGKLYSINKAITIAKGKYFLILDQNCFFLNNDALKNIYKDIEKEKSDIVEFNLYKLTSSNYTSLYRCNHFLPQFNFSQIKYNLRFDDIDISKELLTNKLIKTIFFRDLLKKYNLYESEIIIEYYYNDIFNFIINSNEHKFKRTNSTNIYMNENYFEKKIFNDFSTANTKLVKEAIFYIKKIYFWVTLFLIIQKIHIKII